MPTYIQPFQDCLIVAQSYYYRKKIKNNFAIIPHFPNEYDKAIARKLGAVRCTSKVLFKFHFTDRIGALHLKIITIKVQRTKTICKTAN